jgi:hypothetical protein
MADQASGDELREEARSLDERIAHLEAELEEMRANREPGDQEDAGQALQLLEEQQALLEVLQQRRREVAAELGEA